MFRIERPQGIVLISSNILVMALVYEQNYEKILQEKNKTKNKNKISARR